MAVSITAETVNESQYVTKILKRKHDAINFDEAHQQDQPKHKRKAGDTEHMKTFNKTLKSYSTLGKLYGSQIRYDWTPRNHLMYWVTNLLMIISNFHVLYTQHMYYSNGEYVRILEPFAVYGLVLSVSYRIETKAYCKLIEIVIFSLKCNLKWFSYIKHYAKIYSLFFFARKLCQENIVGTKADILFSGLCRTRTVLKMYTVGVVVGFSFYVIVPLKLYIFDNVRTSILPIEVLFYDQSTVSGFIIATMYGYALLICICNYKIQVDLIGQDFKDLDDMWSVTGSVRLASKHAFLINVFRKHQDMN